MLASDSIRGDGLDLTTEWDPSRSGFGAARVGGDAAKDLRLVRDANDSLVLCMKLVFVLEPFEFLVSRVSTMPLVCGCDDTLSRDESVYAGCGRGDCIKIGLAGSEPVEIPNPA